MSIRLKEPRTKMPRTKEKCKEPSPAGQRRNTKIKKSKGSLKFGDPLDF